MSEPSKEQLRAESKEMFVEEYLQDHTAEFKFELLKKALGEDFIQDEFETWLSEQDHD